jgi:hypothetical protein
MLRSGITHGFPTCSILLGKRVHKSCVSFGEGNDEKERALNKALVLFFKTQFPTWLT